jgi:hypothetical protein
MRIVKAKLDQKRAHDGENRLYGWVQISKKKCPIEVSFPASRSYARYDLRPPNGFSFGPDAPAPLSFFNQEALLKKAKKLSLIPVVN